MKANLPSVVILAVLMAAVGHGGQGSPTTARDLYAAAETREEALRAAAGKGAAPLKDYRAALGAYDALVRQFPTSGYVDNALWQGAGIAREAFYWYGEGRDRAAARRMLALLVSDYPTSSLVPKARQALSRLDAPPAPAGKPAAPSPAPAQAPVADARAPTPPPMTRGPVSLARQLGLGAPRIVIDPGHGGYDPGALGVGMSEAEIALDIALRLESMLAAVGVEAILTRRTDEFVPLDRRPAVATSEQADLFLSIHVNASRVLAARGIESYVLNFATDPDAEAVAARENASTTQTMSNLPEIVRAITLNSKLDESRRFAALIQRTLATQLRSSNTGVKNLGVKQAPFVVLIGAEMPSVLVEVGFITSPQEGRLLKTEAYRQGIAQGLFDAVRGYQKSLKNAPIAPVR